MVLSQHHHAEDQSQLHILLCLLRHQLNVGSDVPYAVSLINKVMFV